MRLKYVWMVSCTCWLFQTIGAEAEPQGREMVTFAGTGQAGYSGDGGPARQALLNKSFRVLLAVLMVVSISARWATISSARSLRDGTISTVAGSGRPGYRGDGGPAIEAELNEPYEIRFDRDGNLFFVERANHLVRRVDAGDQTIATVAGNGTAGFTGDGGPAIRASPQPAPQSAARPPGKPVHL